MASSPTGCMLSNTFSAMLMHEKTVMMLKNIISCLVGADLLDLLGCDNLVEDLVEADILN